MINRHDAHRSPVPSSPHVMEGAVIIASDLMCPEGPIALADGSILFVEMTRGTITRADGSGTTEVVADCGGGPNGLAVGPDGKVYVCNQGDPPGKHSGGLIQRFDLETGAIETLYDACDGEPLSAPNDIVFDQVGGFYFTDFGHVDASGHQAKGRVFYATADGRSIARVEDSMFGRFGVGSPNGIGLSADFGVLYVVETFTGRLYGRKVVAPGQLDPTQTLDEAYVYGSNALEWFDGLAVDAAGNICIATLRSGAVTAVAADGASVEQFVPPAELWDPQVTNLCFGGPDLRDLYVTRWQTGTVLKWTWPRPGNRLAYQDLEEGTL